MKPELFVNWADSIHLDNVKIKKTIKLLLVRFSGSVAYNIRTHQVHTKFSCKDVLFNGRITLDPSEQAVTYRKRIAVPMVGNKLGCLVASGRWAFNEYSQTWNPSFRIGFEFRHGSAEFVRPNTIRFKPRLYLKNVGLEAKTLFSLQLPGKLLFDLQPGSQDVVAARDEGEAMGINLEVQQLDLVIRL